MIVKDYLILSLVFLKKINLILIHTNGIPLLIRTRFNYTQGSFRFIEESTMEKLPITNNANPTIIFFFIIPIFSVIKG